MNKKRKWPFITAGVIGLLVIAFLLGPKVKRPDFSSLVMHQYTNDLKVLEDSLMKSEALMPLKPDNEARIIWATPYQKTPYSMVYLHGNGASQEEGDPIHEALAKRYGCNLYLARLEDHGLKGDDLLLHIDPLKWMQSALDAIQIGKALGEKVIVVSCSTGSTLALYLAATYPDLVEAQIMLSPNVDYYDPRSFMMAGPWGMQMSKCILGSDYYGWKAPGAAQQYWYTRYRVEGIITLKAIIDETMTEETFAKINDPLYLSYYYKDEGHQDNVVSVKRMKEMFSQVSTPAELKKEVVLEDAGTHIIGSDLFNNHLASVWTPLVSYCEGVLHLTPVEDVDWKPFIDNRTAH
ncbi:MAG: alpha/beta hydrolase [Saprospiraceae bacterium]|nr:alpha/beta hydrolase [Saprospiraceae bacterium]